MEFKLWLETKPPIQSLMESKAFKRMKFNTPDALVALDWFEENVEALDGEDWMEMRWRSVQYLFSLARNLKKTRFSLGNKETRRGAIDQKSVYDWLEITARMLQGYGRDLNDSLDDLRSAEKFIKNFQFWHSQAYLEKRNQQIVEQSKQWLKAATDALMVFQNVVSRIDALDKRFKH